MNKKEEKRETQFRPSLERLVRRVLEHYPERNYESENDFYDALDEYETTINDNYEKLLADHNRLTQLMYSNPRMGAFISDVAEGEDAVVACVRYFGKELLDGCGDKEKLQALRRANDEYVERHRAFTEMEAAMSRSVEKSARSIERFMRGKQMSEEDMEDYLDRVFHVCQHVFLGDLSEDVLELLYKGLRYNDDLACAEHVAEVKGRNSRIKLERRDAVGDSLPAITNKNSGEKEGAGRRHRRRSVWDM